MILDKPAGDDRPGKRKKIVKPNKSKKPEISPEILARALYWLKIGRMSDPETEKRLNLPRY
jgi:hypothetical protein